MTEGRLTTWGDVPEGADGLHTQREARRWWTIALDVPEEDARFYYTGHETAYRWSDDIFDALVGDNRTMKHLLDKLDEPGAYIKHCLDWVKVPQ